MKVITDWLEHRTGVGGITKAMLYEHIPGGARWRYVWGSTLVFTFVVQLITGFFLWASYSPSSQTAWESVYYIQNEMFLGWLLRGIHHYTAQAMIILLALHMGQVVIDGAYRAPREVNFWIGLILLLMTLGLSLTGYLLPWDQKGYWATQVATNIMAIIPLVGPAMQRLVVGGSDYGHLTLTRFFALHAGLLPFLMIVFIAIHVYVFRRHGIHAKLDRKPREGEQVSEDTADPHAASGAYFWPDQLLKDAVACLGVLLVVLLLSIKFGVAGFSDVGKLGAELGAPANPTEAYSAARPEWYFLFLFQFLKLPWFRGAGELWGAVIIPGLVVVLLFLMPIFGRSQRGHRFNVIFLGVLLLGIIGFTVAALIEDRKPEYKLAVQQANQEAQRVVELARSPSGIPAEGAVALLRDDPKTAGAKLFAQSCSSCHRYDGHNGTGAPVDASISPQTAPDLKGFASRAWLTQLLDPAHISATKFFGGTKFANTKMARFVKRDIPDYSAEEKAMLEKAIAALSAEANLKSQRATDAAEAGKITEGRGILKDDTMLRCAECHTFHGAGEAEGPDLTGYGSRAWILAFLDNPAHERFYGDRNDRMPAFGAKKLLTPREIGLIADFLRGEWYEPADTPLAAAASPANSAATKPATRTMVARPAEQAQKEIGQAQAPGRP